MVRKANINDIEAVTAIYEHIQKMEADGLVRIGWNPSTYPVRATAEEPYCALSTLLCTFSNHSGVTVFASPRPPTPCRRPADNP